MPRRLFVSALGLRAAATTASASVFSETGETPLALRGTKTISPAEVQVMCSAIAADCTNVYWMQAGLPVE